MVRFHGFHSQRLIYQSLNSFWNVTLSMVIFFAATVPSHGFFFCPSCKGRPALFELGYPLLVEDTSMGSHGFLVVVSSTFGGRDYHINDIFSSTSLMFTYFHVFLEVDSYHHPSFSRFLEVNSYHHHLFSSTTTPVLFPKTQPAR